MNIDPTLPYGIKYDVYQQTVNSYEELIILLDDFLKGTEARKWNLRLYITKEVAEKLLTLDNNLTFEVIYSIRDIHPKLPDLVMVHFSTFSRDSNKPASFLSPSWSQILNSEIKKLKPPAELLDYYLKKNPKYILSNEFTFNDEPEIRYFLEGIFGGSYEKFLRDMKEYKGLFSCIRDGNGKIIAMANSLRDEFNGLIHYEVDHAASSQIGLGAVVASIGLVTQILKRDPNAIITSEIKLDLVQGALLLGLTIPPIPGSSINLYSVNNPLQLIRRQVTIGETNEYFDLLFMILSGQEISEYYSGDNRRRILKEYQYY